MSKAATDIHALDEKQRKNSTTEATQLETGRIVLIKDSLKNKGKRRIGRVEHAEDSRKGRCNEGIQDKNQQWGPSRETCATHHGFRNWERPDCYRNNCRTESSSTRVHVLHDVQRKWRKIELLGLH